MLTPWPLIFDSFLENVNVYFLKDIQNQRKAYVPNNEVKTLYVPHYKNLSLEKIFKYVDTQPQVGPYLPDQADIPKIPKQWIVNVCAAVIGQPFKDWVS